MKLSKALKHKNKLVKEVMELQRRLINNNRWVRGNTPDYSTPTVLTELRAKRAELVSVKAGIQRANAGICQKIYELAEAKAYLSILKSVPTHKGTEVSRFNEAVQDYDVALTKLQIDDEVSTVELKIESLQEEIDEYNATTEVIFS